ncbi:hypothetical protein CDL15_Pgr011263 [Punica granatum]|uniref:Uncharacterized protein n=1 Tax=Punica granatum TaxID=22663 RepID=A0A218WEN1_PUNGR|nr:hypothetical protein CDL15_Pgr011263 [Punica granatum]
MDNLNYHGYILEIYHGGSFKEEGGEVLYNGGEILRWDIDLNKMSATHMIKEYELLEHKYCQLYVKHITDSKAFQQPKAATEGGADETEFDLSEEDDPKFQDIKSQVQIAKKKRAEKLKSLRLHKDLETIIREARQDKHDNKGKEK